MTPEIKKRIEQIKNGKIPKGYKKTLDGIFPYDWKTVRLGDVFKERVEKSREDLTLLSITTNEGVIPRSQISKKDNSSEDKSKYLRICKGDIGYNTMRMWQGVSALSNYEGIVSPAYTILKPTDGICAKYFAFLFKTEKTIFKFYCYSQGLVDDTRNLKYNSFKIIQVTVPPVVEQQRIAKILSAQDKVIECYEKKIEQLRLMKKYYLQNMFPKRGETIPKIRFKGFTDAWEQRKLSEIVDVCSGRDYKHLSEGSIPVYGTGGYMLSVNEALSYNRDAIGIGRKGTIDKPYVLKAPFWTVDTLFYAIPNNSECLDFVYGVFQIVDWKKKDESSGVPSLSKDAINNTDVLMPPIDEQIIMGNFFKEIDNLIILHQRLCDEEKKKKKALQQLLLTGIVRVKV